MKRKVKQQFKGQTKDAGADDRYGRNSQAGEFRSQRYQVDGNHNCRCENRDRQGKGPEPRAAGFPFDVFQQQEQGKKVQRKREHGIVPRRPCGEQKRNRNGDIKLQKRTHHIAGPDDPVIDAGIADNTQQNGN